MIFTVEELKGLAPLTTATDEYIKMWLEGIEKLIQGETNNSFIRFADESGVIHYPADIKLGVLELFKYDQSATAKKAKEGIASETISRHSVSYKDPATGETVAGYPVYMLGFLDPYRKARF